MKDVVDKDGKVTRARGTLKTESSGRWGKLYGEAKAILMEQREKHPNASDDDLVFINECGKTIDDSKVNRTIKAIAKRCGCDKKDISSHVMRHTFGAYLVTKGENLYKVSQLMGHSSIRTTERVYAKLLRTKSDEETMKLFDELNVTKRT